VLVSGPGVARGLGIYATDIAPLGVETIEDVIVHCFRGEATPAEVSHAVAARRSAGDLQFEQTDDPYQWFCLRGSSSWSISRGSTSRPFNSTAAVDIARRRQVILDALTETDGLDAQELQHRLELALRTLERDLAALRDAGLVTRVGSRKTGHYRAVETAR
jgi:DNA-binding transcriptional ArsR family regulator